MEHKPLAQLQALADVQPADGTVVMPRAQRLQRWIELLSCARSMSSSTYPPRSGGNAGPTSHP